MRASVAARDARLVLSRMPVRLVRDMQAMSKKLALCILFPLAYALTWTYTLANVLLPRSFLVSMSRLLLLYSRRLAAGLA